MSMHIEFNDDYSQTTFYYGKMELPNRKDSGEYRFQVSVVYFSNQGSWTIQEIVWEGDGPPEKKGKAETRISELVKEWHGKRCNIDMVITGRDPGDENDNE